jgi:transcription-repair coupling factor (superfamily II helicase)
VAALDLEIRGAGNLLGGEQSGHIDTVGFDMYMKLLEESVRELKGEDLEDDVRAMVNLRVDLKIDEQYVPDMNQRLMVYRKVASARTDAELDRAVAEIRDRYGAPPPSVLNLAEYGRIRVAADRLGVESIDREGQAVVIRFRQHSRIDPARLVKVVGDWPGASLVPPVSLKLSLEAPPAGRDARRQEQSRAVSPERAPDRPGRKAPARPAPAPSWWTARATAGEVTAGFTKEEVLKRPESDPRAEGGMFSRIEALLRALG